MYRRPLIYLTRGRRSLIDGSNGSDEVTLSENSVSVQGWLAVGSYRTKPHSACMSVHGGSPPTDHSPLRCLQAPGRCGRPADPASIQSPASEADATMSAALPHSPALADDDEADDLQNKVFSSLVSRSHCGQYHECNSALSLSHPGRGATRGLRGHRNPGPRCCQGADGFVIPGRGHLSRPFCPGAGLKRVPPHSH